MILLKRCWASYIKNKVLDFIQKQTGNSVRMRTLKSRLCCLSELTRSRLRLPKFQNLHFFLNQWIGVGQLENCLRSSNNLKIININFLPKKNASSGENWTTILEGCWHIDTLPTAHPGTGLNLCLWSQNWHWLGKNKMSTAPVLTNKEYQE